MSEYKLKKLNREYLEGLGYQYYPETSTKRKQKYYKSSEHDERSITLIPEWDLKEIQIIYPFGDLHSLIRSFEREKEICDFLELIEEQSKNFDTEDGWHKAEMILKEAERKLKQNSNMCSG